MKEDQGSRIYGSAKRLNILRKELKKKKDSNSVLINNWLDYQEAEGRKVLTIKKNLYLMLRNRIILKNKPLDKLTRKDVEDYSLEVTRKYGVGPYRRALYYALKQFVTWVKKTEEPPEEVRWLKAPKAFNKLVKEDMLTKEEVDKLVKNETSLEFRALWALLSSAGCRIGEALSIKLKDVKDERTYILITVDGKTGKRNVPLTNRLPEIRAWLKELPEDYSGYVFNHLYDKVIYRLRQLLKKVKIKKNVTMHLFRHSTSTELSSHIPTALLEKRQGWVHGSDMPRTYIHLGQTDEVIKAQLDYFEKEFGGDKTADELEKEALALIWDEKLVKQMFENALKNKKIKTQLTNVIKKMSKT